MTFWGIEVKPGKPFTLKHGDLGGKLILTQATLGAGSSAKKSVLQCNVGDKSPVFLCTLLPDKSECCSLNLEFEEEDDVKFSVVGPTSIHLSGFVHGDPEDSDGDGYGYDSYGEDIADTESEDSDYDSEEDSEADFIDDDDMTMHPPSPVPNSGVVIEEIMDDEKASGENDTTKQSKKKKNQLANSNNDEKALVVKGNTGASVLESEDEDGFPVSSSRKSEASSEKLDAKTEGEQGKKNKKKYDAKDDNEDARSLKRKSDAMDHDEEPKRIADEKVDSATATEVVPDEIMNKKKKKKGKDQKIDATQDDTVAKSKDANNAGASKNENVQSLNGTSDGADVKEGSSEKKKKKKKKKAKTDNGEADANTEKDVGTEAKKTPTTDERAKQSKAKPAKARTFPNGFVIEELQMGKPNGRRASRGSKVSVCYIGKLQKNGKQFDSNIGRAPFKFRLGVGQVIKGWDVGVEGMRIGDKRRLIIPPSMGYGRDGAPPQIPPNAWLVFDVELVDVA